MSDSHRSSGKTNIDNVTFSSFFLWICFWPGLVYVLLFLFTFIGFQPPIADVYFSPTAQAKLLRSIPARFLR